MLKRHEQAIQEATKGRELDPVSVGANANLGYTFYLARQYSQALQHLKSALEMDSGNPISHAVLGYTYAMMSQYSEAIAEYREALRRWRLYKCELLSRLCLGKVRATRRSREGYETSGDDE